MTVRIRFAEDAQSLVDDWSNNIARRNKFGQGFGFANCLDQRAQVSDEDANRDKETRAASPAAQPATTIAASNSPTPNIVAGQALNDKHEPVAGAEVFLFRFDHSDSSRKLIGQTKTNDDGRFQFDNVIDIEKEFPNKKFPPSMVVGNEFIQCFVRSSGLVPFEFMITPGQVAQGGMFRAAVMSPGNTLTGRVTGPHGKPLAGALATVGRAFGDWEGVKSARTDADGNYKIADVSSFDLDAYQKQIEEMQTSGKGDAFFASPEFLTVALPGFATKQLLLKKCAWPTRRATRSACCPRRSGYIRRFRKSSRRDNHSSRNGDHRKECRSLPVGSADSNEGLRPHRCGWQLPLCEFTVRYLLDLVRRARSGDQRRACDGCGERYPYATARPHHDPGWHRQREIVDVETSKPIVLEDEMRAMLIADSRSSPPSGRGE